MDIQWYPGHMAKARRQLTEELRLIDVVAERVDARAPLSSRNPDFDDLFYGKERVVLLNKSDLADPAVSKKWIGYYESLGYSATCIVSTEMKSKQAAMQVIDRAAAPKVQRMREKGVLKVVRAMVVGIPNVGKSTLINRVAGGKKAAVGDRPGVTRAKQWVRITPYLELCDTPGLLWPKIVDQTMAKNLAFLGSINDEIIPLEQLAAELAEKLLLLAPEKLILRYTGIEKGMPGNECLLAIARQRGFLFPGGEPDAERAARILLDEFRGGKLGRITLEVPPETV